MNKKGKNEKKNYKKEKKKKKTNKGTRLKYEKLQKGKVICSCGLRGRSVTDAAV